MSAPFRSRWWLAPAALCFILPGRTNAGSSTPPADDKAKPAETKKVELYRLTNEELLKQADAIFDKVSRDYLALHRALATAELLLEEVRKQTDAVKVPPRPTAKPAAMEPGEDAAK